MPEIRTTDPVLVVGGGRVGLKAVNVAAGLGADVYLMDRDSSCLARRPLPADRFFRCDVAQGYQVACRLDPRWIIPAVPRHLAAEWLKAGILELGADREGLETALGLLPKDAVLHSDPVSGILVLSLAPADQTCLDDCMPPDGACALTGRLRRRPLFALMGDCLKRHFDRVIVNESRQVAPGLGALLWRELSGGIQLAAGARGGTLVVGTASACHGVLNVFKDNRV